MNYFPVNSYIYTRKHLLRNTKQLVSFLTILDYLLGLDLPQQAQKANRHLLFLHCWLLPPSFTPLRFTQKQQTVTPRPKIVIKPAIQAPAPVFLSLVFRRAVVVCVGYLFHVYSFILYWNRCLSSGYIKHSTNKTL